MTLPSTLPFGIVASNAVALIAYQKTKLQEIKNSLSEKWNKHFPKIPENENILLDIAKSILSITSNNLNLGDDKRAILRSIESVFVALARKDGNLLKEATDYMTEILLTEESQRTMSIDQLNQQVKNYSTELINRPELDKKRVDLQTLKGSGENLEKRNELLENVQILVIAELLSVRPNRDRRNDKRRALNTITPEELLYAIQHGGSGHWDYLRNFSIDKSGLRGFREDGKDWIYEDLLYYLFRFTKEGKGIQEGEEHDSRTRFILDYVEKRFSKEEK